MRTGKVELLRCLGEPSELRKGSIRVCPIAFASGVFGVASADCASSGQELGKIFYAFTVSGQCCVASLVRPGIETNWCLLRVSDVQGIGSLHIGHTRFSCNH